MPRLPCFTEKGRGMWWDKLTFAAWSSGATSLHRQLLMLPAHCVEAARTYEPRLELRACEIVLSDLIIFRALQQPAYGQALDPTTRPHSG